MMTRPTVSINFKGTSRQPRKLIFGMHLDITQLKEIWRTTSIFLKMEDDLNFFGNWKTTSIFLKMVDNLNFFENGKQLHFFSKWKTTLIFWKWKTTLILFENGRGPQYFENGRRPQFFLKMEDELNCFRHVLKCKTTLSTI